MVPHPPDGEPLVPVPRTWRPWRAAWLDAAYGPHGFWTTQRPADHFTTAVGAGPLVAHAIAGLLPEAGRTVVDVGAGDGRLLAHLADLRPDVAVVGVDRRPRPHGLDPRVRWLVDHWDVDEDRWVAGGPDAWTRDAEAPLLVAHEWLDDLPVPVVERRTDGWRELEVDQVGHERAGPAVGPVDRAWLARWWDADGRAEVGRSRDTAWAALVGAARDRGGRALAVDYGHVAGGRPTAGTFSAYGLGRRRTPVPDGSVNLSAGVAADALAHAGAAVGAATLLLARQADVLAAVPDPATDPLGELVRRGERAALVDRARWGDLWWLLQGGL